MKDGDQICGIFDRREHIRQASGQTILVELAG
jgi:hypothetical protein